MTENEFGRFKESLNAETDRDAGTMVLLARTLAYRAGLRRRETQMLRIQDIHPGPEPFLLIRPSRLASLKTNSSKRRMPLRPLLPSDELEALMAFRAKRIDQVGSGKLACSSQIRARLGRHRLSRVIDPVTSALCCDYRTSRSSLSFSSPAALLRQLDLHRFSGDGRARVAGTTPALPRFAPACR